MCNISDDILKDLINKCIKLENENKQLKERNELLYNLYKYHIETNYDLSYKISGLYKHIQDLNKEYNKLEDEYYNYKDKLINDIINKSCYKIGSHDDYD